jgi:hypothetical protein
MVEFELEQQRMATQWVGKTANRCKRRWVHSCWQRELDRIELDRFELGT